PINCPTSPFFNPNSRAISGSKGEIIWLSLLPRKKIRKRIAITTPARAGELVSWPALACLVFGAVIRCRAPFLSVVQQRFRALNDAAYQLWRCESNERGSVNNRCLQIV